MAAYPQVSGLLTNPRVTINIDDGRRWLKRQPGRKFDVILMNTTHHWREFASGLLSQQFLELAREHLEADGVVMWNCTDSKRAAKTGMVVFPHTMMCLNNCIGSMQPLQPDAARWRAVLSAYKIEGKPVFDLTTETGRNEMEAVLKLTQNDRDPQPEGDADRWWISLEPRMHQLYDAAEPITDDNLGHEYPVAE
jgi:predicted membrane-bound spermidine synthase